MLVVSLEGDDLRTFVIVQLLQYEGTHRPISFMYILLPYFIYHFLPIKHSTKTCSCSFVEKNETTGTQAKCPERCSYIKKKVFSCLVQLLSINLLSLAGLLRTTG